MQGRLRAAKNKQKFKQNKKGKELLKIMLKKIKRENPGVMSYEKWSWQSKDMGEEDRP